MPEVSVIMSTYNEKPQHLVQAISSVLKQTFQDFEFIIILDNPQNKEIHCCVYKYAQMDKRIKVIANEVNIGLTKSLNKAIEMASGKYMSRMDADDIMEETCLEREIQALKEENLDLIAVSKKNIDEYGHTLGVYINDFSPARLKHLLPYDNSINHPTVMIKMDTVRNEGGYREIPSCEDYDLWVRMLCHGCRMRILPHVLLFYRIRRDGVCGSNVFQLYCSKCFVKDLYRRGRKNGDVLKDMQAYEDFILKRDITERKRDQFNKAYQILYEGIEHLRQQHFWRFAVCVRKAVRMEYSIACVIWDKAAYQIRKYMVLMFVQ